MKEPYLTPEVKAFALATGCSILAASNEGYDVNPFDPGFAPILESPLTF